MTLILASSVSRLEMTPIFSSRSSTRRSSLSVFSHRLASKSQAEKHLEALSEAGSVRMKLNGKAKVFWYNQELVPELSAAEKAKLAADLAAAKAQVARGADELAQLQKSLKAGRARRSLDELTAEALTLRMEVQNEEAALAKRYPAPRRMMRKEEVAKGAVFELEGCTCAACVPPPVCVPCAPDNLIR